jgi:hypothetical protein
MRRLALLVIFATVIGCASSDATLPDSRNCEDRFLTVWGAAQSAVRSMGGRIVHANQNQTGGTILGRLGVEVFGFAVELNITVRRVPGHAPGTYEPLTVSVKAVEPGVSSPDKYRVEELRRLEKQYLDLVGERAMCARVVE